MANIVKYCALSALLALGSGCSKTPELDVNTASEKQIIATHAFDTPSSVTALSFAPNDIAPWLGRIIYIDQSGGLYSTDIEGRDPKHVGTGTYTHVNGMQQIKKPAAFFALQQESKSLDAFIESDNEGRFSPLIVSGPSISAAAICQSMAPQAENIVLQTTDGNFTTFKAEIFAKGVELTQVATIKAPKGTVSCAYDGQSYYALVSENGASSLHSYSHGDWQMTTLDFTPSGFASLSLNEHPAFALLGDEGMLFIDANDLTTLYHIKITDGLSIRGVESASFVTVSSAPFGGAAFNEGVIVLSDKANPRLVFISLGYLNDRLSAVQ